MRNKFAPSGTRMLFIGYPINFIKFIAFTFFLCLSLVASANDVPYVQTHNSSEKALQERKIFKGQVAEILLDSYTQMPDGEKQRQQLLKVKVAGGKYIEAVNNIPPHLSYQVILKKGDRILLSEEDGAVFIEGFNREHVFWILTALFVGLMLWIGGKKGVFAFVSLVLKISLLLFVLLPTIKAGFSPILMAGLFSAAATFLTISLVSGWNAKTLAACIGTIGGVLVAGAIGAWAVNSARLSGLLEPEMESLHFQFPAIKITELISAGVIIGSLGASMDVAISIASALYEVHLAAPTKKVVELYKIGMNIGQDVMGTMVNTLILAYAGSALATIFLISQIEATYLLNMELFMKEIILAIVGSIGLVLTIPATAILSSYLYKTADLKE